MYCFVRQIIPTLFILFNLGGLSIGNSDLCHISTCGLGAICSQNGDLIVCTCPEGWEGEPFKECIPSSSALATNPNSSSSTAAFYPTTTTPTTTTTVAPSSTAAEIISSSGTMFNIPVKTHIYSDEVKTSTIQNTHNDHNHHQQQSVSLVNNIMSNLREQQHISPNYINNKYNEEEILTQFPSAPPTLSHFAHSHTFQQRIQAQPIQFSEFQRPSSPSQSFSYQPSGVLQPISSSDNSNNNAMIDSSLSQPQHHQMIFTGTRTRERPSQHSQVNMDSSNNNDRYYYHDNVHASSINNRNNHQGSSSSLGFGSNYYHDNKNTNTAFSNNVVPHQQYQDHQNIPQSGNSHIFPSQSMNRPNQVNQASSVVPVQGQDYSRIPITSGGNSHHNYPVTSTGNYNDYNNNKNNGAGATEEFDDELNRDATFIKDPLGKYEKCHSVNNIIVCAENSNTVKEQVKQQNHINIQKPQEIRRIDSRPIQSNSNNYFNDDLPYPPIFPISNSHYNQHQQNHYPSQLNNNNRYPPFSSSSTITRIQESSSNSHQSQNSENNNFHSQIPPQHYPNFPNTDFTSPVSLNNIVSSTTTTTMITNNENDPICARYCGEGSVCRIILDRPVCGCPEGHTGDSTLKCYPILNSKYDTKSCQKHTDCLSSEHCDETRCIDPCQIKNDKSIKCGVNARCKVIHHTQLCACNDGFVGNPYTTCSSN